MATEPGGGAVAAYVGIGSNLADPELQVRRAFEALAGLPDSRLLACSPLYRTAPVGPQDQPDYVNAVARLETRLSAPGLLAVLQAIERSRGRVRDGSRWGPRILDLDILLFGGACIDRPGLHLPHPELANRAFALVPLADVAPADLSVPGLGSLASMLDRCPREGVERLGPGTGCDSSDRLAECAAT